MCGEWDRCVERKRVHVGGAHDVTVAFEATPGTPPHAALRFVCRSAPRTPTGRAPLTAGEALDVVNRGLVGEVLNVLAVLPLVHSLVVLVPRVFLLDPIGIANEQNADALGGAERDRARSTLVPEITDAALGSQGYFRAGALNLLPSSRSRLASGPLAGQLAELLVEEALLCPNAAAGHNQGLARGRDNRSLVNLAKVDRSALRPRDAGTLGRFDGHVQLVMDTVPDEPTGRWFLQPRWSGEHEGRTAPTHRQDDPVSMEPHRLAGPHKWVGVLVLVRITDLRISISTMFFGTFNGSQEGSEDLLHGLGVERKPLLGCGMEVVGARPPSAILPRRNVEVPAARPHSGGFQPAVMDRPTRADP